MRYMTMLTALLFAAAASADDVPGAAPAPVGVDYSQCWVELYDEPSLEGDKVRLQGPTQVAKLADHEYSNGENLNNDVRGVRTGATARVVLFGDAEFAGATYRVFPGSSTSIGSGGFGEDSSSMKLACDDPAAVSAPPPGSCWVELFDEPSLEGDKVRVEGPKSIGELATLEYSNGENLNDDVRGVRTGAGARVELFDKDNFEGDTYRVYEGTSDSISSKGFSDSASSIKISCLQ